ncbi:MAG: 4Fe-4S binding protein [Sedimentisphaerales bacterium]|jgi:predicted membrane-bound spermidine synthase
MMSPCRAEISATCNSAFSAGVTRGFVIFAYGLFSISAQTLVFREFITSFESNDITIGIFFACWFLWIAIGTMLVNASKRLTDFLLANIELLYLSYIPAFVLQVLLIIHIRQLAGIAPYTLLPISAALLLSALVNAPVSFITGLLFPLTCRWVALETTPAVSRVYLLESLGSFIGGLGTTVLLTFGISSVKIFLLLAFILSLAVLPSFFVVSHHSRKKTLPPVFLLVLILGFAAAFGVDKPLAHYLRTVKWSRLLPADSLTGSFQTAQAEYLYGLYQNQWVAVREGSVVEAVPDPTSAGRIVALTLSQNLKASRVLVIGSGLALCREFLQLPQIDSVVWANPDSEYIRRVLEFVPRQMSISDKRFESFTDDPRALLSRQKERFDLVIINLPDATSSILNRYFTIEFYEQLKTALGSSGVLAVRIPAGENIMGTELATIGASTKLTLEQIFSHIALVPGDNSWFIVSDSNNLTGDPGILRERFASIPNAANSYPPNGLLSIYLPDRAAKAFDAYNAVDLPAEHLLNRDSRPLANLYALLLAAKESDAPVTLFFKHLLLAGLPVFLVPVIIYVILRLIFILTLPAAARPATFDFTFLIFSTGAVGIGVVIVLMYLYQTRFGSLYLHIGAISSMYMAGLAAGATIANRLLQRKYLRNSESLLMTVLLVHCAVLAAVAFWPASGWSHISFAVAFIVCGLCAGSYFPIIGNLLAVNGLNTTQASVRLEYADHIGAAAGGLLAALVLIPILGAKITILMFILLTLANLPATLLRIDRPGKFFVSPIFRSAGYALFGIAVSLILCSNLLVTAGARFTPALPLREAQVLVGSLRLEAATIALPNTVRTATYFKTYDANDKLAGFIFSSADLAPNVQGFGGKINIAIRTDAAGNLLDFHIISSNETPSYLDMLTNWLPSLKDHTLFSPQPFANVDTVTGATVSSKAVLESLAQSGSAFATQILGQNAQQKTTTTAHGLLDSQGIYLVFAFLITLLVIYRGGLRTRLFVLGFNVLLGGIFLNAQFSTEQIASLLSLAIPLSVSTGAFILAIAAPLLAIVFGNIYCGYLCPFGALQEFIGYVLPARFRPILSREQMQKGRFVKFVVLFVLVAAFFLSRNHNTLAIDPLIRVFSFRHFNGPLLLIAAVAVIGSFFYSRFWCRYLCPAGAFLSLFNKIAIFSRFLPAKRYANCEYGLSFNDKLDCIYCDKCRYEKKSVVAESSAGFASRYFLPAVLVIAIGITSVSVESFIRELPVPSTAVAASPSAGQPRNVDTQKIKNMIRENKLSEHEADFYKKTDSQ